MSTLFLTRSSNVPAMMYKLFVFVTTFLTYFNLSQSGCPIIANKESIDGLFGRNQTLVCSLKRCKSASWFNLTEGSYLNSCDSQPGCSTSLQETKEIILNIHNLSPYQTGTYICVCKEPRIKTIKCFDIIGVCQMWIEVNNHTMVSRINLRLVAYPLPGCRITISVELHTKFITFQDHLNIEVQT